MAREINICPKCEVREKYTPPSGKRWGYCKVCMNWKRDIARKNPQEKIDCQRGGGQEVTVKDCEENQGCNDACFICEHFKEDKTLNAMSIKEQREAKYTHQSVMAHEYDFEDHG